MPDPTPKQLIAFIEETFDPGELQDLCIDLGVNYYNLAGDTLSDKVRGLVLYMTRRKRLAELSKAVAHERPEAFAQSFSSQPLAVDRPADTPTSSSPQHPLEAKQAQLWIWILGALVMVALAIWAILALDRRFTDDGTDDTTPPATLAVVGVDEATVSQEPSATPTVTDTPELQAGDVRTVMRGGVPVEQVFVPAGSFQMGNEAGLSNERPVHEVTLDAFWLDRTEVTNEQFAAFVADTGYQTTAEREGSDRNWRHPQGDGSDLSGLEQHPVVNISWIDAAAFTAWAGGRLPTEAEWEYAARGPENLAYPWGNTFNGERLNYCDRNCQLDWADQTVDDGYGFTAAVGSYPDWPSWAGALDMSGNVSEWVNDWYGSDYYARSPDVHPPGPDSGDEKTWRGGAWNHPVRIIHVAFRDYGDPVVGHGYVGVRVAEPLSDPDS